MINQIFRFFGYIMMFAGLIAWIWNLVAIFLMSADERSFDFKSGLIGIYFALAAVTVWIGYLFVSVPKTHSNRPQI